MPWNEVPVNGCTASRDMAGGPHHRRASTRMPESRRSDGPALGEGRSGERTASRRAGNAPTAMPAPFLPIPEIPRAAPRWRRRTEGAGYAYPKAAILGGSVDHHLVDEASVRDVHHHVVERQLSASRCSRADYDSSQERQPSAGVILNEVRNPVHADIHRMLRSRTGSVLRSA